MEFTEMMVPKKMMEFDYPHIKKKKHIQIEINWNNSGVSWELSWFYRLFV